MGKKIGIIVFPGSNCDQDSVNAINSLGAKAEKVWHKDTLPEDLDGIIVPGGFSYGDYLRCGAMAANSPIAGQIKSFSESGKPVLGICNGFQVLTELRILPGALLLNNGRKFICREEPLVFHAKESNKKTEMVFPIAHGEGRFHIDQAGLDSLKANDQIAFSYSDNPNGSVSDIAGIRNKAGNVLGLMPHPERATEDFHESQDGRNFLKQFFSLEA